MNKNLKKKTICKNKNKKSRITFLKMENFKE